MGSNHHRIWKCAAQVPCLQSQHDLCRKLRLYSQLPESGCSQLSEILKPLVFFIVHRLLLAGGFKWFCGEDGSLVPPTPSCAQPPVRRVHCQSLEGASRCLPTLFLGDTSDFISPFPENWGTFLQKRERADFFLSVSALVSSSCY